MVWTDVVKTFVLLGTVIAVATLIAHEADTPLWQMATNSIRNMKIVDTDPDSPTHWLKHIVAGALSVVAMTGLDQDLMQRTLSCRNRRDAQLNVVISGALQPVVIFILLTLGAMMKHWTLAQGAPLPTTGDQLFATTAVSGGLPVVAGVLFVLGLAASSFSSAGSAVTALTTSVTLDILGGKERYGNRLQRARRWIHTALAALIALLIVVIHSLGNMSAIDTVFRLAAYTYGPLLGLFVFGMTTRHQPRPAAIALTAIASPALSFAVAQIAPLALDGFRFGHDILLINAIFMFAGLACFSQKK